MIPVIHLTLTLIFSVTTNVRCNFYSRGIHLPNDALYGEREFVNISGDIKLGALVAIYDAGGQVKMRCNASGISPYGIMRVEAMKFAINQINRDQIIPNVTLGIEIRDSCGTETRALDEALHFVTDRVPMCRGGERPVPIFGVVGASMSSLTAAAANLLRLFQIPLVSYAATSTELSNTEKYDFLLRTVPPDSFQSAAMVDFIVDVLEWKSVFVIYSAGNYGEFGHESFIEAVSKREKKNNNSLCVVEKEKIKPGTTEEEILNMLNKFDSNFDQVVGIVCYCEVPDITKLISVIDRNFPKFRLIGSDTTLSGKYSNKSLIFSLAYERDNVPEFFDVYENLTPSNSVANPWFHKFWNESCAKLKKTNPEYDDIDCANETAFGLCRPFSLEITCPRDDKIPYTIDAIYAFAYAIKNLLRDKLHNNITQLLSMDLKNRDFFDNYLKKVKFLGRSGNVTFDEQKERGSYDIIQFYGGERHVIARWKEGDVNIKKYMRKYLQKHFTDSTCQKECARNEKRAFKYKTCCWFCEPCARDEYLSNNECIPCVYGEQPNNNFDGCAAIPIQHIPKHWKIMIGVFSSAGILATLFTLKVFLQHNDTPIVKASGRELTYLLILGIFMLFCNPLVMLVEPNEITCGIIRFNFAIFLCLCYGALLVKTNRIARIFTGKQDLSFLTPSWQLILTALIMMPQLLATSVMLIRDNRNVRHLSYVNFDIVSGKGFPMCTETNDLYITLAYNIFLVVLCTYYAFVTRKVPANFNESRYIGFVMYTTIVLWCAFLPVYFGISFEQRIVYLMIDHILNALTLLVGLFGMKMYILLFRPDKNSPASSKLRSVTFFSEGDIANGAVYIDGISNGRYKTISSSNLVQNNNSPSVISQRMKGTPPPQQQQQHQQHKSDRTQTRERGTSTTGDEIILNDKCIDDALHTSLHKTFTM